MHDNENSRKKKSKKKSSRSISSSVIISMVAVFALIIVGFSQISFAIPEAETLGEEFTSKVITGNGIIGTKSSFNVNQNYTDDDEIVFCIERNIAYLPELEYKRQNQINDAGLMYILANVYPNENFASDLSTEARVWLAQSAIWIYVAGYNCDDQFVCTQTSNTDLIYANNTDITADVASKIYQESSLYDSAMTTVASLSTEDTDAGNTTLYKKYGVDKILARAEQLRGSYSTKVEVSRNTNVVSLTTDGKYYQTDYINVYGTVPDDSIGSFNGYQVDLVTVPEGTFLIDTDGNEIKDYTNLSPGTKFALRVPVANVTDENKKIEIEILGSFDTYFANKYVYDGSQTVVSFKQINNNVSVDYEIDVNYAPRVPDTAENNSSMYFFIGIILLLSGLGIFYTSAKKN